MFRFESFGSGSSGNAYVLVTDEGNVLIDAGVGIRKLKKTLHEYGISLGKTKGILVTHNHVDHVRSLGLLNQKELLPAYLTALTLEGIKENPVISKKPKSENVVIIEKGKAFKLCGMNITPFEVPHDSKDNVGYFIEYNNVRFCIVTDCGHWTDDIEAFVGQTDFLVLESNYDEQMLKNGPYPVFLQNRIRNGFGHLSNSQASEVISRHQDHLRHVWLCHLSEKNNSPELAMSSALGAASKNCSLKIETLSRLTPSKLYDMG